MYVSEVATPFVFRFTMTSNAHIPKHTEIDTHAYPHLRAYENTNRNTYARISNSDCTLDTSSSLVLCSAWTAMLVF